jgi:hypothetical protein
VIRISLHTRRKRFELADFARHFYIVRKRKISQETTMYKVIAKARRIYMLDRGAALLRLQPLSVRESKAIASLFAP